MLGLLLALSLSATPGTPSDGAPAAPECPGPRFGSAGTWAPSGFLAVSHQRVRTRGEGPVPLSETTLSVAPRADYFVLDDLGVSFGAFALFSWSPLQDERAVGAQLGGGYNFWLHPRLSLYPTASLRFYQLQATSDGALGRPYRWDELALDGALQAMVLVHFGQFYRGAGPSFTQRLMTRVDAPTEVRFFTDHTRFDVGTTFGGWLD
jgi:hypothetical protein